MGRKPSSAKRGAGGTSKDPETTPRTKRCIACASEISAMATVCPECQREQEPLSPCIKCGKKLTVGTRFCKECQTWQDGRFHFSLTQWVSVASSSAVIGIVTFLYQCTPSITSVHIDRASADAVYVVLSNKAPKNSSHLVEARFDFGDFPLENATLEPIVGDEKKVVVESGHVIIGLAPRGLGAKIKPGTTEPYTKDEILTMLDQQNPPVTLWVVVVESNERRREIPLPMRDVSIRDLINEKLTDRGT